MTNKYFDKMYEVNPQEWTMLAAVVYEQTEDNEGNRYMMPMLWDGTIEVDEALESYTGKCQHCNHHHVHFVIMGHENGDRISIGWQCYNETFAFSSRQELDLHRAKKAAEAEAHRAKVNQLVVEYTQENPEVVKFLEDNTWSNFYSSLLANLNRFGSLTEKQEACVVRAIAKAKAKAEREATRGEAKPAPMGRFNGVELTVISTKWVENPYSYNDDTYKVTAEHADGWRVHFNAPSYLEVVGQHEWLAVGDTLDGWQLEKGNIIKLNITLQEAKWAKNNDGTFCEGKRPAKAQWIG